MHISSTNRKHYCLIVAAILTSGILFMLAGSNDPVQAQGHSRESDLQQTRSQSFESRFWHWLQSVQYRNWAPAPETNGDAYPGESPHGSFLKLYLNRTAAGRSKELPHGSIIVKENFGSDQKSLMAITVMYRTKAYDPNHNDWYWVKYNPDGSVARMPLEKGGKKIAGQVAGCIECHSGAEGKDFCFLND